MLIFRSKLRNTSHFISESYQHDSGYIYIMETKSCYWEKNIPMHTYYINAVSKYFFASMFVAGRNHGGAVFTP